MTAPTICLIGPGHVASTPRLVKEADSLAAAGYRVRVVYGTSLPQVEPLDRTILVSRSWATDRVPLGSRRRRVLKALRQRLSAKIVWGGLARTLNMVAWAESELAGRLARTAAAEPADLYIGHYLPGLYAAWFAAKEHGAAYGFDIEDSHTDELPDDAANAGRRAAREWFERTLLAGSAHLTASSPLIAEAYEQRYGRRPAVVLNVFPLADAPTALRSTPYLDGKGPPTLYWFSQTIGPGRGLEPIITAMGQMGLPVTLHLRGIPAAGYREKLTAHAATRGIVDQLVWHPPAEPDQMAQLSAGYDLGLALELTEPPNRAICLTNKAFTYLLAGVPAVLSRTPAQEKLAEQLGLSGLLIDLKNSADVAVQLTTALGDRQSLRVRRAAAWQLGQNRFNWDTEQGQFLSSVEQAFVLRRKVCVPS